MTTDTSHETTGGASSPDAGSHVGDDAALAAPGSANAALDEATIATLMEAIGDDQDFLAEVIDTYVAGAVDLLAAMRRAVAAGSAADLAWAAHDLKSSSSNLGGLSLAAVCQALESGARSGSLAGAAERVAVAEAEYQRMRSALAGTLGQ